MRELAGLQQAVGDLLSGAVPRRARLGVHRRALQRRRRAGEYIDALHGWSFISEAYALSDPDFGGRITVPVLWDTVSGRIVNNESSDIIRMMAIEHSLGGLGTAASSTCIRSRCAREIDAINARVYETVNNGVYRAGFARRQDAYEHAFAELFDSFEWLEELLGERRYLLGERITEADWRLFPTLVRFDEVYNLHFRCNRRRLVDYPNLWGYARELYQWPRRRARPSRWTRSSATTTRPTTS